jgi:hypothetical protein
VQTDNRADNVGMLAINRALGFKPAGAILIYEKSFGDNDWRHEHRRTV